MFEKHHQHRSKMHAPIQIIRQGQVRIQRGGGAGVPDPPPPGKTQVIWVSIGNKQLDPPPPPGKSWIPLENVGPPLEP